jgi:Uma2 family endonuclease
MSTHTTSYIEAIEHMPPGSTLILTEVPWNEYERLLADLGGGYAVRLSYNNGRLEVMSPSAKHEKYKELILLLANALAEELNIEFESFGSTTFKREMLAKGAEPDTCFYVQHASSVAGNDEIDLNTEPPPDVVVEVDVAHTSQTKLELYASLGVPEVWHYDHKGLKFYHLSGGSYEERPASVSFPIVTSEVLNQFLELAKSCGRRLVLQSFREFIRERQAKP